MKKIFMASICAIMAVTAANADIASTSYVDDAFRDLTVDQVGADGSYIKYVSQDNGEVDATAVPFEESVTDDSLSLNAPSTLAVVGYVKEKTDVISDGIGSANEEIKGLKSRADALEDEVDAINNADTGILAQAKADATSKANAAQAAAATDATTKADKALADAKTYADQAEADAIAAAGTAADGKITAAVGALDVTEVTVTDGNYFNAYAETDGKISMKEKAFEGTLADGIKNAPQTGAVKSYVDAKVSGQITELDATVNATANQVVTGVVEEDGKLKSVASTQISNAHIADNAAIAQSKIAGLGDALGGKLDKSALEDAAKKAADQGDGTYSLTMKVENGAIKYQWDMIRY